MQCQNRLFLQPRYAISIKRALEAHNYKKEKQ
jgi:hypothetical protein